MVGFDEVLPLILLTVLTVLTVAIVNDGNMVYPMKVIACLTVREGQNQATTPSDMQVTLFSVKQHYNAIHTFSTIKHAHTILGSSVAIDTVSTSKT